MSIGQILLLPKPLLEKRVLSDERIDIYAGGRDDIRSGQIDRRVLATLEYLAESGLRPDRHAASSAATASTRARATSPSTRSGNAVDIADGQRHPDPRPPGAGRDHRADRAPPDAAPGHDGSRTRSSPCSSSAANDAGDGRPQRPHPRRLPPDVRRQQEARQAGARGAQARPVVRPDRRASARSRTRSCRRSRRSTRCRPSRSAPARPTSASRPTSAERPVRLRPARVRLPARAARRPLPGAARPRTRWWRACWCCRRSARPSAGASRRRRSETVSTARA